VKTLVATVIRNAVFANLILVLVIFAGLLSTMVMIREVMPSFLVETVQIQVPYPGAGPEEVEEGICLKIEDAIEGIQGIKKYITVAREGLGVALIDVYEGEDVRLVKDRITDRINAVQNWPDDAERPIVSEFQIRRDTMILAIHGDVPERQLRELALDIKDELLALPVISDVEVTGIRDYEISIEVSEATLRKYGLTMDDVTQAVRRASLNLPGGRLRSNAEEINIRTMGRMYTGVEYEDIVVVTRADGTSIRLGQIATIRDGFVEDVIETRFNGQPAVSIVVFTNDDEDALRIANAVYAYMDRKNEELPPSVQISRWLDSSRFIVQRIDMLTNNGMIGLALVFMLLWMFLDLRLAFWVSAAIPVSIAGGLFLMWIMGQTINMLSLFALIMVLGIIVDDAIIVGEAIYVHRKSGKSPIAAAVDGTAEVAWPVIAAVLTTIVAFTPLFFVKGMMGKFIAVIPAVVVSALTISLLESLTTLPVHLSDLPEMNRRRMSLGRGLVRLDHAVRGFLASALETFTLKIYRPVLKFLLGWRYVTIAGTFSLLLLTLGIIQSGAVKYYLFPKIDTSFLTASVEFPEGTPVSVTREAVQRLEEALQRTNDHFKLPNGKPLVIASESTIGQRLAFDQGYSNRSGSHWGGMRVEMQEADERGIHYEEIIAKWRQELGPIPGAISVAIDGQAGGPPGKPIEIWLMGEDLDDLRAASTRIQEYLQNFTGLYQIQDDFRPGKRELRARLKPEARPLGLTTDDLARQLRYGFYGSEVLRLQRGREEIKVWLRYPESERQSVADVDSIRITTPSGARIPLESVAEVSLEDGYTTITRKDGQRRISITADADLNRANPTEVLRLIEHELLPTIKHDFPHVTVSLEGEKADTAESLGSLYVGFPLAMLMMYVLIAAIFQSYTQPAIIMLTVPFGFVGAVLGHLLLGYDLTMMSLFGLVALAGIVVNDAIVLIDGFNDRLAHGASFARALVDAGTRRFRPILLTSLTTMGGLTPLIMERSLQAQFLVPMALTIAFGVAFSTVLTLLFIPCVVFVMSDFRLLKRYLLTGKWTSREEVEPASKRRQIAEQTGVTLEQRTTPVH
jgi:multidrug efflux pump subunit AcrB